MYWLNIRDSPPLEEYLAKQDGVVLKNKVIPAKAGIYKAWMILKRFPPAWE
ncbi:hypothetical protein [Francisella philomiragia]|uniref:hypothetical protein n=1 Tax=Francisella philomiragia TaxID=28110 RepID=UPI00130D5373|nr:hypothetical protein [Francisella philomiragia]